LIVSRRYGGTVSNLNKAEEKLGLFRSPFLEVDIEVLLEAIRTARAEIVRIGRENLQEFRSSLIPTISLPLHSDLAGTPNRQ